MSKLLYIPRRPGLTKCIYTHRKVHILRDFSSFIFLDISFQNLVQPHAISILLLVIITFCVNLFPPSKSFILEILLLRHPCFDRWLCSLAHHLLSNKITILVATLVRLIASVYLIIQISICDEIHQYSTLIKLMFIKILPRNTLPL